MKKRSGQSGFTLLEIIIVIIIIGVLASLALPKLFKTIEYSKSAEALSNLSAVRQATERCIMASAAPATDCVITALDVADPSATPGARFDYTFSVPVVAAGTEWTYTLQAARDVAVDCSGSCAGNILLKVTAGVATRSGTGIFSGVH